MTQTKTGASRFGGRLFKSAATSALALSAVAGGVMLSGGEAKALTYYDPGLDTTFTDTINVLDGAIGGTVELEPTGAFYPTAQKQVDVNYAPGPLRQNDVVLYTINKTGIKNGLPVKVWFDQVSLTINATSEVPDQFPKVTKEVFAVDPSIPGSTPIVTLMLDSRNLATIYQSLPNHYNHLWVRDTLTPNGGRIDNAINDFRNQVPGPLPILGAGAAFGFSRKLRGRIKASRTA